MRPVARLGEKLAVVREVGVGVGEEANAAFAKRRDARWKIREARSAPFTEMPVPKQPAAEGGFADSRPVFAPQA